jgi:hypothetical protein
MLPERAAASAMPGHALIGLPSSATDRNLSKHQNTTQVLLDISFVMAGGGRLTKDYLYYCKSSGGVFRNTDDCQERPQRATERPHVSRNHIGWKIMQARSNLRPLSVYPAPDDDVDEASKITTADLHRAAWASSLGSALEYYDFALYSLASALIFGPLFFPSQEPGVALLASFGTYFLGFAVRPLGGIVFGILGDKLGRKFVLLATVVLMGLASTLIGLLPTYASVGVWSPVMLVALRLLRAGLALNRPGGGADDGICAARTAVLRLAAVHGHPARHGGCGADLFPAVAAHRQRGRDLALAAAVPAQRGDHRRRHLDPPQAQGIA